MADDYPAYERPRFTPADLSNVRDPSDLRQRLDAAFQRYRRFTTQVLSRQKEWVEAVREIEVLNGRSPRDFGCFETEPCMTLSPLVAPMEPITDEELYVYLTADAARESARDRDLELPPRFCGNDEMVMALETPPYAGRSASSIKKQYKKRGRDLVTQGDVRNFIAISSTEAFDQEESGVWLRSTTNRFDIVAFGRAYSPN